MKCFYHPKADAVGICKHCQKGLCHDCVVDWGNGISCAGRCEEEARAAYETASRTQALYATTGQIYAGSGLGSAAFGVIFIVASSFLGLRELSLFLIPAGILLILGGLALYAWGRRLEGR
jgi:hypothetical protein